MTWSQIVHFSRAAALADALDWNMRLAIAHNPMAPDTRTAQKLWNLMRDVIARLRRTRTRAVDEVAELKPQGIKLGDLERMMGTVKRQMVSREEWEARRSGRTGARNGD